MPRPLGGGSCIERRWHLPGSKGDKTPAQPRHVKGKPAYCRTSAPIAVRLTHLLCGLPYWPVSHPKAHSGVMARARAWARARQYQALVLIWCYPFCAPFVLPKSTPCASCVFRHPLVRAGPGGRGLAATPQATGLMGLGEGGGQVRGEGGRGRGGGKGTRGGG